ncbi:SUMO ligase siz1 [Rhizophlyctis rosea]|nr:SUMO ligase siz1 [Rhizophlyctis rosea]
MSQAAELLEVGWDWIKFTMEEQFTNREPTIQVIDLTAADEFAPAAREPGTVQQQQQQQQQQGQQLSKKQQKTAAQKAKREVAGLPPAGPSHTSSTPPNNNTTAAVSTTATTTTTLHKNNNNQNKTNNGKTATNNPTNPPKVSSPTDPTSDDEFQYAEEILTLKCPITLTRMKTPVKGRECLHRPCFDATHFQSLNANNPKWKCPICGLAIGRGPHPIDTLFQALLAAHPKADPVKLNPDGTHQAFGEEEEKEAKEKNRDGKGKGKQGSKSGGGGKDDVVVVVDE